MFKGPGKKKITVNPKSKTRRDKQISAWERLSEYNYITIPLALGLLVVGLFMLRRFMTWYSLWKRQIRNI
jgi:hypothetical protein